MLRIIVRGGGGLVAGLILSTLLAGVALGTDDHDLLDVEVNLGLDAVVDLVQHDEPLVEVDGDASVDLEVDVSHHDDQPLATAGLTGATVAVVNVGGGHDGPKGVAWLGAGAPLVAESAATDLLNVEGAPTLWLGVLIGQLGGPFDGAGAASHTQVPIDLELVDEDHNLVHVLVGATSDDQAFVGDVLLATIGADACVEAIIGPGAPVGCEAPEKTIPDAGEDGDDPGDGDPIEPADDSGEAPGAGSVPDAAPVEPGGATGELPDTAAGPAAAGWLAILGALLALVGGAWSVRRRVIGG